MNMFRQRAIGHSSVEVCSITVLLESYWPLLGWRSFRSNVRIFVPQHCINHPLSNHHCIDRLHPGWRIKLTLHAWTTRTHFYPSVHIIGSNTSANLTVCLSIWSSPFVSCCFGLSQSFKVSFWPHFPFQVFILWLRSKSWFVCPATMRVRFDQLRTLILKRKRRPYFSPRLSYGN
jgi:hypothetical protein